jgi:uncharacterized protein YjbI with pentapeptide repeats
VDQEQQSRWRPTRRQVLWTVGVVVATVVASSIVLGYVLEWEWTGLVKDKAYTKRTLWDWLQLLIIPAVLAAGGLWFNQQQRDRELEIADRRAQDEALQAYLNQIGQLLLDKDDPLRDSQETDEVRVLARAQTLTVLGRLDGGHKRSVLQFLYESELIIKDRVILTLKEADLRKADLRQGHLRRADLRWAHLSFADLRFADLIKADLSRAYLIGTNLSAAQLSDADLSDADLSDATGWTEEQLSAAKSLEGATMPDGRVLKGPENPNGPTFTEWRQSREGDEENSGP